MKKNGFVFAETIIVIAVLCFGLITIYSSFSLIVSKQKEEMTYNQANDIQALYLIRDYILDMYGPLTSLGTGQDVAMFSCKKETTNTSYYIYNSVISTVNNDYNMCAEIFNRTNLWNVYFVQNVNGSTIIKNLNTTENNMLNATLLSYIKTLSPIESTTGDYMIIGEYIRNGKYYYSSLIMPRSITNTLKVLKDTVLLNAGGASAIVAKGTPTFSTAATTNLGMYSATDFYGTSYYYRGVTTNNYVFFANKMWRIVRINGDGTIRMILNDYAKDNNGTYIFKPYNSATTCINNSITNTYTAINCVRYKYGLYAQTSISQYLENWYSANFNETESKYIVRRKYCNNYSFNPGSNYFLPNNNLAAYTPSIICNTHSSFTLGTSETMDLYVGMLTSDEVNMAGGIISSANSLYYLYLDSKPWWLMSPRYLSSVSSGTVQNFKSSGNLAIDYVGVNSYSGTTYYYSYIRPVINLASNTQVTGSGTSSDPYLVRGLN